MPSYRERQSPRRAGPIDCLLAGSA
jgi:hypothetical protein